MTDSFFDSIRPHPEIQELYDIYIDLEPVDRKRISRIGARLWASTELSPAGAFELTMKLIYWLDKKGQPHDTLAQ